jgi:hypothetical protein
MTRLKKKKKKNQFDSITELGKNRKIHKLHELILGTRNNNVPLIYSNFV